MKNIINELYNIKISILIRLSTHVYKIKTEDNEEYILKYLNDDENLEGIYSRLSILNISSFLIPIQNIYGQYISNDNEKYFQISHYYNDELIQAKDMRLKFFMKELALLHSKSQYYMKVNDGFFEETYDYVINVLEKSKQDLNDILFKIEALDYKSPSAWLLLMNNQLFFNAIDEAKKHIEKFIDLSKELKQLRVALVYQNFDYQHIILKSNKIIGTEKLCIAPPIYDLKYLFDYSFNGSIDLSGFIKIYLDSFSLLEYEKEWLLGLLFIPSFNFKALEGYKELEAIVAITRSIQHFNNAFELSKLLTQDE
ncbi:MAG: hypothetical protein IJV94_02285 [Bacilli bacterium]|nr:hypothetical protein [Bacilli bacterium]